jgi:type I restriction enzyme S subunit
MTTVLDEFKKADGWDEIPFRAVAKKVSESGYPELESLSVFLDAGVVPRSSREDNHNQLGESLDKYQRVLPNDLVFNKLRTWQGGFGISSHEGIVSPAYIIARPDLSLIAPRFLGHLLKSKPYLSELTRLSKWMPPSQFDISWESIRDLKLRIPPISEQRRISDYLDEQVIILSNLVALKESQIAQEEKLKDLIRREFILSGVQNFCPLKYVTSMTYGSALASEDRAEGDVPVMSSGGVSGSHDVSNTRNPAIIIGRKGSFGSVHWSDMSAFVIDTAYFIDNRNTKVDMRWLYHVLKILNLNEFSVDVGIPGLSREVAYHKLVPVPPSIPDQAALVEKLEKVLDAHDKNINYLRQSITLLKEYKDSLVTSAVTGKMEVTIGKKGK